MPCVLCEDIARTGDVVLEDDATAVVLHGDWSVRGHAMVVHRRHVENVSDLRGDEWEHFSAIWRRAERALLALTGCERAVILKLGVAVPHLHVHIYPVPATASREDVFAAIDGRVGVERDEAFVASVRAALR